VLVASAKDSGDAGRINVDGTQNVLDAMRAQTVPRLIFASSVMGYGSSAGNGPYRENEPLCATEDFVYGFHRSPVLDEALGVALGPGYREGLPREIADDTPLRLQDTWMPRLSQRRRYLRHEDFSYGDAGIRNNLDIWHRQDLVADGNAPVLVQIHGSAWVAGSKRGQSYPLMAHMAERGWVCVSINYSLAPVARWPAHIIDVKRALAWVKRDIKACGGDPDRVALTGGSAGGHLTALAALTANEPVFPPGFESRTRRWLPQCRSMASMTCWTARSRRRENRKNSSAESSSGPHARNRSRCGSRAHRCRGFAAMPLCSSFCTVRSTP
jgi:hypothetical protein